MSKSRVATKTVVKPIVATKPVKKAAPPASAPTTAYDLIKKKNEADHKAVEAFLAKANKQIDAKNNKLEKQLTKKETAMPKTTKKATKKEEVKSVAKKAVTKKEVAPVKKSVKKEAPVKNSTKKEAVMKKGSRKVEVETKNHNFVRNEVTVRESLAKYNNKLELEAKTDKVYLIDKSSAVVLKRKMTTSTHNLTVFVRKNAGKNAKALDVFTVKANTKDKAVIEKLRAQYKGKAIVVEVLSDRPYIYIAKDVHVCVRYIKLSK